MTACLPLQRLPVCILALTVVLAGCSPAASRPAPPAAPASPASTFRVAAVMPDPDNPWTQSGLAALKALEVSSTAQITYTLDVSETASEALLRGYAQDQYDLIIGHGGQYVASAESVAKDFPRTRFAVMGGSYPGNSTNLSGLDFKNDEIGYLMGIIAAMKTKTDRVALIAGVQQPEVVDMQHGFGAGVRSIKPTATAVTEWVGSWDDQPKTKQIAERLIADGYDVIGLNSGSGDGMVVEMARDAGIYVVGTYVDRHETAPSTVLLTFLNDMSVLYTHAAISVQQGTLEGKLYRLGIREGAITLTSSHGLLSPAEEQTLLAAKNDLVAGNIAIAR